MGIIFNVPVTSLLVAVMHYNVLRWVAVERRDPARARVHRCRLGEARTPPPRHRHAKYGPFMHPPLQSPFPFANAWAAATAASTSPPPKTTMFAAFSLPPPLPPPMASAAAAHHSLASILWFLATQA